MEIGNIEVPKWLKDDMGKRRKAKRRERRIKLFDFALNVTVFTVIAYIILFALAMKYTDVFAGETVIFEKRIEVIKEIELIEVVEDKSIKATITAYTSSVDETDLTPFITASGARTGHGIIACPPKYDFGTKVVIEGKEYECQDRMNERYNNGEYFDIWVESKEIAFNWGRRDIEVFILK